MAVALRMFRRKFPSKFDLSVFDYKRKKEKKKPSQSHLYVHLVRCGTMPLK